MGRHVDLPDTMLHEPKHIQTATNPGDAGKVIVSKGDGTSELRFLQRADSPELDGALTAIEDELAGAAGTVLSGVYLDAAAVTGTVDVTIEEKQYYFIGPTVGQDVSFQLPDPADVVGFPITLKRLSADGTLTVLPFSTETVEGSASLILLIKNNALTLVSDGTDWRVV